MVTTTIMLTPSAGVTTTECCTLPRNPANDTSHAEVRYNKISQQSILSLKKLTMFGAANKSHVFAFSLLH
ncbi:hypothetical protein HanRHA438_Chr02g0048961 [Helianthus annuus]|nr:hypothetical protein HanRHA438_Chr02g0048961 [Helianthus annuus]